MPIPALTVHGYLPAGRHDCTLDDVELAFCGTPHRSELLGRLRLFLMWLRNHHGVDLPYYVDGSYTTAKEVPGDIDFVIDLSHATPAQINIALNLWSFDRPRLKAEYGVDFWYYHPGAPNDLRGFFEYVRVEELQQRQLPADTRKGILRIQP